MRRSQPGSEKEFLTVLVCKENEQWKQCDPCHYDCPPPVVLQDDSPAPKHALSPKAAPSPMAPASRRSDALGHRGPTYADASPASPLSPEVKRPKGPLSK